MSKVTIMLIRKGGLQLLQSPEMDAKMQPLVH